MPEGPHFRPNSLEARDIESLVHPYTNLSRHRETGPHLIERGEGIYVFDNDGNALIEGMSGLWCTALGYGEQELIKAATQQMEKLAFTHLFGHKSHEPAIELAEMLKERAPGDFSHVLFMNSGSEANDAAIKLIWYYNNAIGRPEKKKIIARDRAYHGITVASASLTMLPANQNDWDLPLPGFLRTRCPHPYREMKEGETEEEFSSRLAAELEELILAEGPETIAAMFAEPVQGAGGVIIPPKGYFREIQKVLAKYDILLVADEVITGFCRTGNYWGSQSLDLEPDILTCAKALSSAYLPIGALLVPDFINEALVQQSEKLGSFGHGSTYAGHPVCAAVAKRALELYDERDILGNVRALATEFARHLAALGDHPLVGDARSIGLLGALELVADKSSKAAFSPPGSKGAQVMQAAVEAGLIVRALGDTIALCPPLIISPSELDELFSRLSHALDACVD